MRAAFFKDLRLSSLLTATLSIGGTISLMGAFAPANAAPILDVFQCGFNGALATDGPCEDIDQPIQVGDKIVDVVNSLGNFPSGPGTINFSYDGDDADFTQGVTTFNVNFQPPVTTVGTFEYFYDIRIDPAQIAEGYVFDTVAFSVDSVRPRVEVDKLIVWGLEDGERQQLVNINGQPDQQVFVLPGDYTALIIEDTFSLSQVPGALPPSISSITQEFTQRIKTNSVPGPLPLFGAAAAFSFSRRLRNRVSSAVKA